MLSHELRLFRDCHALRHFQIIKLSNLLDRVFKEHLDICIGIVIAKNMLGAHG